MSQSPLTSLSSLPKVSHAQDSPSSVQFGAQIFMTQTVQIFASFPSPGDYFVVLDNILAVPGGLPLTVEGLPSPITLRLIMSDEILRVKVRGPHSASSSSSSLSR